MSRADLIKQDGVKCQEPFFSFSNKDFFEEIQAVPNSIRFDYDILICVKLLVPFRKYTSFFAVSMNMFFSAACPVKKPNSGQTLCQSSDI